MIRNFVNESNVPRKLIPKFKGPYKVTKVLRNNRYVLEDPDNYQHKQIPYKGVWEAKNIKRLIKS